MYASAESQTLVISATFPPPPKSHVQKLIQLLESLNIDLLN